MGGLKRALALALTLAVGGIAAPSAWALGGPVILGGDDLTDHGSVDGSGNSQLGWLYIEKAIGNIESGVTRTNDNTIAAFGSAASGATSADAGAAIGNAATKNGMTVQYFDGSAAINSGLASIAAGTYDPAIIWIAGNGANNDIDLCAGAGSEGAAITANTAAIDDFVNEGGGLMAHSACYQWLSALVPGIVTVPDASSAANDLYLTPAGTTAFPGLTAADIGAGPWHNFFQGDLGGLGALARSNTVNDSGGDDAAVIIGGRRVSLTVPPADLFLTMSDSPDPVNAGSDLTYTITVTNNGPSSATGVTVTDNLPGGLSASSVTVSQGSCSGTTTISCNLGNLALGASAIITIVVQPGAEGTLTNTATATAVEPDADESNNSASTDTEVEAPTDLFLTMSDSPDPVDVGSNLTYTLAVTNNGPNPATGVTLTDTLPAGVNFVSATPSQGSCSGMATVTCNVGTLANGASAIITIVVQPTTTGVLSNSASVAGNQSDPSPLNNVASVNTTVQAPADLSLTMTDSPDPVDVGSNVTYTLTASNNGPNPATGVTVIDNLPAGANLVSATPSQGSCSGTATITCNLGGLASGASATVTIVVQAASAGTLSNPASVTGNQPDPNPSNDDASADTAVGAPADLSLTMSDSPDPVTLGQNLTYTLTATNNGPNPATGVTVIDNLPGGLEAISATPSQGTCSGTSVITCALGGLASGASATIVITLRPGVVGTLLNPATVAANQPDLVPANNDASAETTVGAVATVPGGTDPGGTDPGGDQPPARQDRTAPRVRISGITGSGGRSCARRAFSVRLAISDASQLRRVALYVDGKRIRGTTRKRFAVRIRVRGLRAGRHRLVVIARDRSNNRTRLVRRFSRCDQPAVSPRFTG